MLYTIKNNLLQPIVCTLVDGSDLILMSKNTPNKDFAIVSDKQITPYLENLKIKGFISMLEVVNSETEVNKTVKKSVNKEKEEK